MKKYLVYDPFGSEDQVFDTEEEALIHTEKLVQECLEDGEWDESVESIVVAEIKYVTIQTDVVIRPPDDELQDGYDSNGIYWGGFEYEEHYQLKCNYKIVPVETVEKIEENKTVEIL